MKPKMLHATEVVERTLQVYLMSSILGYDVSLIHSQVSLMASDTAVASNDFNLP